MLAQTTQSNGSALRISLYGGAALVVISMLFLGRQASTPLMQGIALFAAPVFFYLVGALVCRYLDAPLAGPGIVATGAWLIVVALVQTFAVLLPYMPPNSARLAYGTAALFVALVISLTGHRFPTGLIYPLVPIMQFNAVWAVLHAFDVPVALRPALVLSLAFLWWELRWHDERWARVYRLAAVLLTFAMLSLSYWLPAQTNQVMLTTWAAGALMVALLALRRGLLNLWPLAFVMLAVAAGWGLPSDAWPLAWLALAVMTIIFIERMAALGGVKNAAAAEISVALAVVLSGASALFAKAAPIFGAQVDAPVVILTMLTAGLLLGWLGGRRRLAIAVHMALWLIAAAWADVHLLTFPDHTTFGLWLTLPAAAALVVQLVLARGQKRKALYSLSETLAHWPLADLILGLTAMIVLWIAGQIMVVPPFMLTITLALLIVVWVAAGVIYRLPILLHIALWLAPLLYALLLLIMFPALYSLPLMGLMWQLLGVVYLLLGHGLSRLRPAVVAPFFVAGYALVFFGLTIAMGSDLLMPLSLLLVVLVSLLTSAAVLLDRHPAWTALVEKLVPPDRYLYAAKNLHNLFLLFGAWLLVVWLYLMLGYTRLTLAQQGIVLVLLSSLWFALGRMLPRFPGAVGWPVYSAGWLMWLIGLLQVFYSPAEAITTAVLGLVISGEAYSRSKQRYWLSVVVLQVVFSAMQIIMLLGLPLDTALMALTVAIGLVGLYYDALERRGALAIALTGAGLSFLITVMRPEWPMFAGMTLLALATLVRTRRWEWLLFAYTGLYLLLDRLDVPVLIFVWIVTLTSFPAAFALHGRFLPYLSLAGVGTLLLSEMMRLTAVLPLREIGSALSNFGLMLAAAVLGLHLLDRWQGAALRRWRRPLSEFAHFLMGIVVLLVPTTLVYSVMDIRPALTASLLTVSAAILFAGRRQTSWLVLAALFGWGTWALLLRAMSIDGFIVYTLPLGVGLIVMARLANPRDAYALELVGVGLFLGGTAWEAQRGLQMGLVAALGIEVVALLIYGYLSGRRVPFVWGSVVLFGGLVYALYRVNFWLLPLGFGVGLLGTSVLLEARRPTVERLLSAWTGRWQSWR